MAAIRIGIVGYEQVNALDVVGPAEAFASAFRDNGKGKLEPCYQVTVIGLKSSVDYSRIWNCSSANRNL